MTKSNFDQSSTGVNIEIDIRYDIQLSQIYFDDFKNSNNDEMPVKFYRKHSDYCVIGDITKPYYKKSELSNMKKCDLINLICQYDDSNFYMNDAKKHELIEDLLSMVTWDRFIDNQLEQKLWHDLDYTHEIVGYSQGDKVKVLIIDSEYNYITKEYLTNIFYDCPISGIITIDDDEYYIDEYLDDIYSWDNEEFLTKFAVVYKDHEQKEYISEFLEENLNSDLDYV